MIERPYLDSVIEVVSNSLEDSIPKIRRAFVKWIYIKEDDELNAKNEEADENEKDLDNESEKEENGKEGEES